MLAAQFSALAHGGDTGIGFHAAQLDPLNAVGLQLLHGAVIYAVALNAAAAVDHQNAGRMLCDLGAQFFDLALAEVDCGGNGVSEVLHKSTKPFRCGWQHKIQNLLIFILSYLLRTVNKRDCNSVYRKMGEDGILR